MAFTVRELPPATAGGPVGYRLEDAAGDAAEVRPDLGFNCYRWQAARGGKTLDLLFADDSLLGPGGRPTRGGIPILFPFPNRIRDARFQWGGRDWALPATDSNGRNAIHGFACRRAWRVAGQGADQNKAWLTGEFASADAPEVRGLWPADYRLRVTYLLMDGALRLLAELTNPDDKPLPFGLGYHPYFRLPFSGAGSSDDSLVSVPARSFWELDQSLPTGKRLAVDAGRDLNRPRRLAELKLDDVLTDLPADAAPDPSGSLERSRLVSEGATLKLSCSPTFREMVVFTPPHRRAFCVEPYTCPTDAVNLQGRGVDAGWLTLPPGGQWAAVVDLTIS
jgi:aldose 1-epimerase